MSHGIRKRRASARKHGIDFVDAVRIFRGFILTAEGTCAESGAFWPRVLEDQFVSVLHTERHTIQFARPGT
jgi:hypothetical protein